MDSLINTRFMVLSDTHNFSFEDYPGQDFRQGLPKIDVLLHCGDLTQCGGISSFKRALSMLGSIEADLKLVIAGNHDLELDKDYWATHLDEGDLVEEHDEAMDVWTGKAAKEAGVVFLSESTHTFILKNGAKLTIYASPYTPEFCDWAFPYEHNLDRFNGRQGCDNILRATSRAKPRLHCFGHIHEGYGATRITWQSDGAFDLHEGIRARYLDWILLHEQHQFVAENLVTTPTKDARHMLLSEANGLEFGTNTFMVNAAIMTDNNEPLNLPWVVLIPLPQN
ncbi:hypothetical protein EV356DRAFT_524278 [Viridothelium virens]|uniref:Calcineurin-like phosphoesterase domain-containing protein n=1 Tax=Viridothelium virens TaxID=1048519 RepID=A0A6A6H7R7_VIRVR|nr:hypothetical protein EV356DRAFT_524278 [Viridothelium virens]